MLNFAPVATVGGIEIASRGLKTVILVHTILLTRVTPRPLLVLATMVKDATLELALSAAGTMTKIGGCEKVRVLSVKQMRFPVALTVVLLLKVMRIAGRKLIVVVTVWVILSRPGLGIILLKIRIRPAGVTRWASKLTVLDRAKKSLYKTKTCLA